MLGRACDDIKNGYRRVERGKHVIIYRVEEYGIFVGRILHDRMPPRKHVIE